MQTNDWYLIELLVLNTNTWNYSTVRKQLQYLIVSEQIN